MTAIFIPLKNRTMANLLLQAFTFCLYHRTD